MSSRRARLHLDGWAGRTSLPVIILRETPKRYEVRLLAGAYRLRVGEVRLVPKDAVTIEEVEA